MPARDRDHAIVRDALVADGWTITNDPLHIRYVGDDLYVDLAAERLIAAEKGPRRIAVEIKTFNGPSEMVDLHAAVGQFVVYREVLAEVDPTRELYLAVSEDVRAEVFDSGVARLVLARHDPTARILRPREERDRAMDPVEQYREAVMTTLREWELRPGPESTLRFEAVFDRDRDRYLVVMTGWDGRHHVHATLAHVDVIDGKLWIQHDQSEQGIAPDLVAAGVPRDRIVLAFKSTARRAATGYAVS